MQISRLKKLSEFSQHISHQKSKFPIIQAYLEIEVIENEKTMNYGRVEINVEKIRETKDGMRVMMELENNKLILKF